MVAPLGASTVLLFGHPRSPLAQPRNLVVGLAVGLTIALGQALRCLHPPAGAVALLAELFSRLRGDRQPDPQHWL